MTFDEMKRIADARTKDGWFGNVKSFHSPGLTKAGAVGPLHKTDDRGCSDEAHNDAAFIAMVANNWNQIVSVIDKLKLERRGAPNCYCDANSGCVPCEPCSELIADTDKELAILENK